MTYFTFAMQGIASPVELFHHTITHLNAILELWIPQTTEIGVIFNDAAASSYHARQGHFVCVVFSSEFS